MALETVRLDDLTWSEMVTAIRGRIAADSEGRWTLHAPVDPGVTLLELFAWLLEQRLYWMDQLPDSLERAAMVLLGVEAPEPARAAATVLKLTDQADSAEAFRVVEPGARFQRIPLDQRPRIFSNDAGLTLLPVVPYRPIALHIDGRDRTLDLQQGRILRLFPSDGSFSEVKVVLRLSQPIPAEPPTQPFSLWIDLRASVAVPSQWSAEAVPDTPPPATVGWWYRHADGEVVPFASVDDGTGGLRRSGIVRLPIPANWAREPDPFSDGASCYAVLIRVPHATFSYPPRLERLEPNTCIGRNQWRIGPQRWRQTWLPLPGNRIRLVDHAEEGSAMDYQPMEQSITLKIRERDNKWYEWTAKSDLALLGPADRNFVVDREGGSLLFGDGLTGRLPVLSEQPDENIEIQYALGGGSEGNLGENLHWEHEFQSDLQAINSDTADEHCRNDLEVQSQPDLQAVNLVAAEGGADPETMASARQRAGAQLKRPERAITGPDFEEIARTTPGVAIQRAHAAIGYHPSHPCIPVLGAVTVIIVPGAPREEVDETWLESAFVAAPVPDPGALSLVRDRLDAARLISTETFVCGPRYRPVALTADVEADTLDSARLKEDIETRLTIYLDPLIGGDEGQGWPFGEPIRSSALLRDIQMALGREGEAIGVSICLLDVDQAHESCGDVAIGAHDLVELKDVSVRFTRSTIRRGGLR